MAESTEIGAIWRRWDPHVHAPGTQLNDLFTGTDPWEDYLCKLEAVTPALEVIGLTDYYNTDTYARMREAKDRNGRLPNCTTLFPNIEMRLGLGTAAGSWVNVHMLVSPQDPNHLDELKACWRTTYLRAEAQLSVLEARAALA